MPAEPLLRRQLLTWLLVPLSLLLVADAFVSYWVALRFAQRAYDRGIVEIAREISLHLRQVGSEVVLDLSPDASRLLLSDPDDRVFFDISGIDGRPLAGSRIARAPAGKSGVSGAERLYDGEVEGSAVRIVELETPFALVRVAETQHKRDELAREILASVVLPQVLLILIAGIVVWIGVVRGLAPLERLRGAVAARSSRDRSPVVVENVPGEVRPLVGAINALLERVDRVLTLQSRFISDAAHQLKTPVTVLGTQLELARREEDPARMRQALDNLAPALERLSRLVSQLLSLARNEPEAGRVKLVALDLNDLAFQAATDWVPEALKRHIDLGFEGSERAVTILGDAQRLRELFDNLFDNAVRYSREGGNVTVRVTGDPDPAVEVNDDSPSIPPEERQRVFERFHRLLGSSRDGSGLGLAIAQEIARSHGAQIVLRDDSDGIGNSFCVVFPHAPHAQGL